MQSSTNPPIPAHVGRLSARELSAQLANRSVTVVDVREPMEYATGHIAGSLNVPLARLHQAHPGAVSDLEGGVPSWEQAGLPLRRLKSAPLPLMRQVQIAAGSLVLLGLILSQSVAPSWILLTWFVGAGLLFAGLTGTCGMARVLALMPWNRVNP